LRPLRDQCRLVCDIAPNSSGEEFIIMTRHIDATFKWGLLFSVFLIASSAIALPTIGEEKKVNGCTMNQIRSPQGAAMRRKMEKDIVAKRLPHALFCLGSELKCCIKNSSGDGYSHCEDLGSLAPQPDIMCADMARVKGVWTPNPKSIRANAD